MQTDWVRDRTCLDTEWMLRFSGHGYIETEVGVWRCFSESGPSGPRCGYQEMAEATAMARQALHPPAQTQGDEPEQGAVYRGLGTLNLDGCLSGCVEWFAYVYRCQSMCNTAYMYVRTNRRICISICIHICVYACVCVCVHLGESYLSVGKMFECRATLNMVEFANPVYVWDTGVAFPEWVPP